MFLLVVDHDDRHTLLIQLGQLVGELAREDGEEPCGQLCGEQMVDDGAAVARQVFVVKCVEDELIGCLLEDLADAAHEIGKDRPGEDRHEHANQTVAPTRESGGGDAGHVAFLRDDAQDALAGLLIDVGPAVHDARYRRGRNPSEVRDVEYRRFLCHRARSPRQIREKLSGNASGIHFGQVYLRHWRLSRRMRLSPFISALTYEVPSLYPLIARGRALSKASS